MTLEELKTACGSYYSKTEAKEVEGDLIYKTVQRQGIRHLPLGYFPTELKAVESLYAYLKGNELI